jgi:cytochrome P450
MSEEVQTEERPHYAAVDPSEVPARYLEVTSLPGREPLFDDLALGHTLTMGIEEPHYHERLREIRETVGVAPVWAIKGVSKAYAITRFDDIQAAFLDPETFSPAATQALLTFPFMGEQMFGFEGRKHTDFRNVVFPAFSKRQVPKYDATLHRHAHAIVDDFVRSGEADIMEVTTGSSSPAGHAT